jgi:rubrerythrin
MVDMAIIGGITSSLNAALNIAKAMLSIRDQALIQEKIIELTGQIIAAQQSAMTTNAAQLDLLEQIRSLEKKIVDMETWEAEKLKYELKSVSRGARTYVLKSEMQASEEPHWICAACYQNGKKFILQCRGRVFQIHGYGPSEEIWECPSCKTEIQTDFGTSPTNPPYPRLGPDRNPGS